MQVSAQFGWDAVVICLERGADLHTAQLMPLPLIVSCFSEIQTGLTFLVPGHPSSPGQRAVKRVCVTGVSGDSAAQMPYRLLRRGAQQLLSPSGRPGRTLLLQEGR